MKLLLQGANVGCMQIYGDTNMFTDDWNKKYQLTESRR